MGRVRRVQTLALGALHPKTAYSVTEEHAKSEEAQGDAKERSLAGIQAPQISACQGLDTHQEGNSHKQGSYESTPDLAGLQCFLGTLQETVAPGSNAAGTFTRLSCWGRPSVMPESQNPRRNLRDQSVRLPCRPAVHSPPRLPSPQPPPHLCIPDTYMMSLQLPPPARSSQHQASFLWVRGKRAS